MFFEWDRQKNSTNKSKHGIDFKKATELWDDPNRVEIRTTFDEEKRFILLAKLDDKIWAAIFTTRGTACRIISVRRARKKETLLYEESEIS
jgi:uncharacterized DUF497 family protein